MNVDLLSDPRKPGEKWTAMEAATEAFKFLLYLQLEIPILFNSTLDKKIQDQVK